MRSGYIVFLLAVGIGLGIANCPAPIKSAVAERVGVPEHVVTELSRQMSFFTNWASQNGQTPEVDENDEIILVLGADA